MAISRVNDYQRDLQTELTRCFTADSVVIEWPAMRIEPGLYSPRLDVAVGPFATNRTYTQEYDQLADDHLSLLEGLYDIHVSNLQNNGVQNGYHELRDVLQRNENARCFLAIEIENKVSNKHLMGGAINASALGRLGLAVAWDESNLRKFIRMRNYLLFLTDVGKNSFDTTNLLILTAEQLLDHVRSYAADNASQLH